MSEIPRALIGASCRILSLSAAAAVRAYLSQFLFTVYPYFARAEVGKKSFFAAATATIVLRRSVIPKIRSP